MRVLIVLVVLFAGCAESVAPELPVEEDPPAEEEPPTPLVQKEEPPLERATPLHNITELYWATAAELGDVAFQWTLDFGSSNECTVTSGVTGESSGAGTRAVFIRGSGWGASGGGAIARASTPVVNTDDILGAGGSYGSGHATRGTFSGTQEFTRVAMGVQPVEFTDMNSGYSLSFAASCQQPFSLLDARTGTEALVGDTDSLDVSASVFVAGGAGSGRQSLQLSSDGHVRFGSFGAHAGQVALHAAGEDENFVLPVDEDGHLTGGPGEYAVEVDRAGAYFEAYWHTIYSVPDDVNTQDGLLPEPAYWPSW